MNFLCWRTIAIPALSVVAMSSFASGLSHLTAVADDKPAAAAARSGIDAAKIAAARRQAIEFLRTTQADDGSWTPTAPGVSGLVTLSLLRGGVGTADPM